MESRGRGIRGARKDDSQKSQEPPTPVSTAWADFMTEEGMGPTSSADKEETKEATSSADKKKASTASQAPSLDKPREYTLPLVQHKRTTEPLPKKLKTTATGSLLVQTGTLDSVMIGRNKRALNQPHDLTIPTSIMPALKVSRVIASCNASHAICIDTSGVAHGWGRNEAHQLSQALPTVVPLPTKLELEGTVVDGAVGKSHTILLDSKHSLWAVGANKAGQCGVRTFTDVPNFRKCVLDATIVQVTGVILECSGCPESSDYIAIAWAVANSPLFVPLRFLAEKHFLSPCRKMVMSIQREVPSLDNWAMERRESILFQQTNSVRQQLLQVVDSLSVVQHVVVVVIVSHCSLNLYVAFTNCHIFTRRDVFCHVHGETHAGMPAGMSSGNDHKVVPMQEHVRIGYIACGKHHTVAIEAPSGIPPRVFTWGCGNYGCLGHGVQQDEYHPRLVATLSSGPLWQNNPAVSAAAGSSCSMILTKRGHVYYWGKHRSVGEAMMRPTLLDALANNGHVVTHVAAGASTVVCSTENAVTVSWGMGTCHCCSIICYMSTGLFAHI